MCSDCVGCNLSVYLRLYLLTRPFDYYRYSRCFLVSFDASTRMGACNAKSNKPGSFEADPSVHQGSEVTNYRPVYHSGRSQVFNGVDMGDGTVAHLEDTKTKQVKKGTLFGGGGATPTLKPKKKNDDAWEDAPGSGFQKIDGPPKSLGEGDAAMAPVTEEAAGPKKSIIRRVFGGI